jgi:hypothetical protein
LFPINSGVPQGSVLGPMLYLLFTSDLPQESNVTTGTLANDTVILTSHNDVLRASSCLQVYITILQRWLRKWKIKINESKSTHLTFTLRTDPSPPLYLNNVEIPPATTVKYLGLHLDTKLTWKDHVIKKRKQMDIRHKELYWLLGRKSSLSVDNKLLLYKSIITPRWTNGIELWGCASKSNIAVIQRCQSKILTAIVDALWYVTNDMIHSPRYPNCTRSHPRKKYQAPYKTNFTSEPTTPTPSARWRHTKIKKTVASWPVTPRWRGSHHASKPTNQTQPTH